MAPGTEGEWPAPVDVDRSLRYTNAFHIARRPAHVNLHVAAARPSQMLQLLLEHRESFLFVRGQEHADSVHPFWLLSAHGRRFDDRRTTKKPDRLPPLHKDCRSLRTRVKISGCWFIRCKLRERFSASQPCALSRSGALIIRSPRRPGEQRGWYSQVAQQPAPQSPAFGCPLETRPYSRSCLGRELGPESDRRRQLYTGLKLQYQFRVAAWR